MLLLHFSFYSSVVCLSHLELHSCSTVYFSVSKKQHCTDFFYEIYVLFNRFYRVIGKKNRVVTKTIYTYRFVFFYKLIRDLYIIDYYLKCNTYRMQLLINATRFYVTLFVSSTPFFGGPSG